MDRIGGQLLSEAKAAAVTDNEKSGGKARDLLSLLVRANTAVSIPESARMSDKEVLSREDLCFRYLENSVNSIWHTEVPTFLVAGHETTRSVFSHPTHRYSF